MHDKRGPAIGKVTSKLFCRTDLPVLGGSVLLENAFKKKEVRLMKRKIGK
jgi:hypothetical protein